MSKPERQQFLTKDASDALTVFRPGLWKFWWRSQPLSTQLVAAILALLALCGAYALWKGNPDVGAGLLFPLGLLLGIGLIALIGNLAFCCLRWVFHVTGVTTVWRKIRSVFLAIVQVLFWACLLIGILVAVWPYLSLSPTRSWYALTNSVAVDRVDLEKKPHDCEFSTAPLGDKNCHYDAVVTKILWSTSTSGESIESIDGGKTWESHVPGKCDFNAALDCKNIFDPEDDKAPQNPTVTGLVISWEKVQD